MQTPNQHQVYAEQVNQLYSIESVGLIATVVNSSILIFIQWPMVSHLILTAWFLSVLTITLLRYLILHKYQTASVSPVQSSKWAKLFIAGAAVSGTLWGLTGIFMFPINSITHQVFLGLILGGMVAGAAAIYSALMEVFFAYSIPALIPITVRFFNMGDELHFAMGTMALLFGVLMTVTAKRINHTTATSFKLRFENQNLINYLADAKDQAEKVNKQLKSEIEERQRAEEELKQHREQLENIVTERTAELVTTNKQLAEEIEGRKRFEEALQENEKRYRELADLLPQPVFETDLRGHVTFANRTAFDCFGYTQSDLDNGLDGYQTLIPEDRERARKVTQRRLAGEKINDVEYMAQRKDGSQFPIISYASPIQRGNQVVGLRGIIVDITERKKMEEELLKTQKLESLGILAGGLAHDFNNILTAIIGNLSLSKIYAKPGDKLFQRLTETEAACFNAKEITQQLLTFSKGGEPVKKPLYLSDSIRNAISFALRGSNVKSEFSITEDLWPVELDEGQFNQAINNLILNAKQAMPEGGVIRVAVENVVMDQTSGSSFPPGRYLKISIEDQGIGIAPEHLSKIFDPYFTTKQSGSGLGLATVYSIINNHSGYITVKSEVNVGSTFFIYLPASEQKIPLRADPSVGVHVGKGSVLIMDDEEMVRDTVGEMLRYMGYETAAAKDGAEALKLYQKAKKNGTPFAAVIMDLTIPGGMGGKETIQKLLELDPHVKAIVSSGYSNDPILSRFYDYGFKGVVAKPYKIEELNKTLQGVINGD